MATIQNCDLRIRAHVLTGRLGMRARSAATEGFESMSDLFVAESRLGGNRTASPEPIDTYPRYP